MAKHSLLSASSSFRWINCPPSARLCEKFEDNPSPYAQEGTDCHKLCAYKIEKAIGKNAQDPTDDLEWYSQEMEDCAESYCSYVMEQIEEAKKYSESPWVLVEQRLDYSSYTGVEDTFGTADCLIAADGYLHVIDYKHGLGILISAEANTQLSCYALGALDFFDAVYDIDKIKLTIYQPRRSNVSTWTTSKAELLEWARTTLSPAAKLAYAGEGEFRAGDHCRFCKAKAVCRKRAEYNLELAKYDFADPDILTDKEIADVLSQADELVCWANDVKDYALRQALSGTKYPGYKIVEGRSNRRYANEKAAAEAVEKAGYDPYEKRILGITAMKRMLGTKKFDEILGDYILKPTGKPTLVLESDKRPAMNTAIEDFTKETKS